MTYRNATDERIDAIIVAEDLKAIPVAVHDVVEQDCGSGYDLRYHKRQVRERQVRQALQINAQSAATVS